MLIAIWIVAAVLLALWSAAGWGLHALMVGGVQWMGELEPLLDRIPHSEWIERWMPGAIDAIRITLDVMQQVLGWMGGAAPALVWVVWAVGAVLLLGLALVLTLVVALVRKNMPPAAGASPAAGAQPLG